MTDDDEVQYESIFREHWRERQSAGARPGELIKQPGWVNAGLVALVVLLAAGAAAAGTVTVAETAALPAAAAGMTVTAAWDAGVPPGVGTAVQFRDSSGQRHDAVITESGTTDLTARLHQPTTALAGELLVPAGRHRLISVLLPRLW